MLALQLKELEADQIISKAIYPVIPPKTEYQLTSIGKTLEPVIMAMEKWGETYNSLVNNLQPSYKNFTIVKNASGLILS